MNGFLNRETREALSPAERSYLHESFQYTGGGLILTALAARSLFRSGVAFRIMSANPWVFLGVSLVGSIGTMMGTFYTAPENKIQKHLFWLVRFIMWLVINNFLSGLQCLPGGHTESVIFPESCHLITGRSLYLWCGGLTVLCRSYCHVSFS